MSKSVGGGITVHTTFCFATVSSTSLSSKYWSLNPHSLLWPCTLSSHSLNQLATLIFFFPCDKSSPSLVPGMIPAYTHPISLAPPSPPLPILLPVLGSLISRYRYTKPFPLIKTLMVTRANCGKKESSTVSPRLPLLLLYGFSSGKVHACVLTLWRLLAVILKPSKEVLSGVHLIES